MKYNRDPIPMESMDGDRIKAPFNGSKFVMIPTPIILAHHHKLITNSHYELLRYIISRYSRNNIIPPKISNDDISFTFNITKEYAMVMVSELRKKDFIKSYGRGSDRKLSIPQYEEILIEFNSNK